MVDHPGSSKTHWCLFKMHLVVHCMSCRTVQVPPGWGWARYQRLSCAPCHPLPLLQSGLGWPSPADGARSDCGARGTCGKGGWVKGESWENSFESAWEKLVPAHPTHTGHHFSCAQRVEANHGPLAGQKAPSFCFHSGAPSFCVPLWRGGKGMALLFVPGFAL